MPAYQRICFVFLFIACLLVPQAWAGPSHAKNLTYTVVAELPHDPQAFTQGLLLDGGYLYESTGLFGRSSLRRVVPATGRVEAKVDLDPQYFGEGLALWGDKLIQITWRNHVAFVYDKASLRRLKVLTLDGEGWGLASTPLGLVLSDGSNLLTWRNPETMAAMGSAAVTDEGRPVANLNELEWAEGRILANVWHEDRIAVLYPAGGQVEAWIDCSGLRARVGQLPGESDLNGLAYDAKARLLYVTGKLWPKIFVIRVEGLGQP
jgi:glutamine cyclotransferase